METLRFGNFELDVTAYQLRHRGQPVSLERQPMELLMLLVERRRQLVPRGEIAERLWGKGVFHDVDQGVNTAIRKIRLALSDSPEASGYIETVPGKGYRFDAPVEAIEAAVLSSAPTRLAVLPFETVGSPGREYLGDGLTEETIASLGQIAAEHLRIIGRTSTMQYRKTEKSLAAIGAELHVDYVVEGSVRHEGDRLRVTASLVRVRDQAQVWTSSYDREVQNMLGVQEELSAAIAEQVTRRLSPERVSALSRRQTRNAEAYDLYLRGRRFWNQLTPSTTRLAVDCFVRATELDPDYALAWAGIAEAYASSPMNGDAPPDDAAARARHTVARAVRGDPDLAEVQQVLGDLNFFLDWDWGTAETAYRRVVVLDPSFAFGHSMLGHLLSQTGRHDEAMRVMARARELDPLSALDYAMSSQVAFQAREYATALEFAQRAVTIDPGFWVGYMMSGQAYDLLGNADLALEAATVAGRLSGGNSKPLSLRGYILAKLGRRDEARDVLAMFADVSRQQYVPPYAAALVRAGLNEPDEAFAALDRAAAARDVHLIFLPVDAKWDGLRADPRFARVIEQTVGFLSRRHPGLARRLTVE